MEQIFRTHSNAKKSAWNQKPPTPRWHAQLRAKRGSPPSMNGGRQRSWHRSPGSTPANHPGTTDSCVYRSLNCKPWNTKIGYVSDTGQRLKLVPFFCAPGMSPSKAGAGRTTPPSRVPGSASALREVVDAGVWGQLLPWLHNISQGKSFWQQKPS